MDNTENEIMEYATNAVEVLNGSYSNSQDNLSNMGCNNKFQEFEEKFNMLDTKYDNVLDKGKAYDNDANQTNNVKNNNLISDKHKSISSKNILSDAFANIQKDEEQIFFDFKEMIRINNENNMETENADNSIWSMIGKSLDNLFTNLVGGLVSSAKAESGGMVVADADFFRDIGKSIDSNGNVKVGGYTYNVNTHKLTIENRETVVDYYIPTGYTKDGLKRAYTITWLCAQNEGYVTSEDMSKVNSPCVIVIPHHVEGQSLKSQVIMADNVVDSTDFMIKTINQDSYCKNGLGGDSLGGGSVPKIMATKRGKEIYNAGQVNNYPAVFASINVDGIRSDKGGKESNADSVKLNAEDFINLDGKVIIYSYSSNGGGDDHTVSAAKSSVIEFNENTTGTIIWDENSPSYYIGGHSKYHDMRVDCMNSADMFSYLP